MRHPVLFIALLPLLAAASGLRMDREAVSIDEADEAGRSAEVVVRSRSKRESVKDTSKNMLTQTDRIDFLTAHNEARSVVSPTASNMPFMVWNKTLENLAQRWAVNCAFDHGQPDETFKGKLGQNLWAGSGGYDPAGSVGAWDKEKADYTYATLGCADGEICGHYTQVVWAKSTQVGCGIAYCEDMESFKVSGYLIVCNYFKPGNYKNKAPYETDTACSACPEDYTGGCTNKLCRQTPMCGGLTCESGTMDTATCLCDCGDDPDNAMGPFCGDHPGASAGVRPWVRPGTLLLTAALGALLYSNL